jgi:hypothetical protein
MRALHFGIGQVNELTKCSAHFIANERNICFYTGTDPLWAIF